jgi:hypothetical protein
MIASAPKTYSCSVNEKTTATKCKGYSKQSKLYFKDYFDVNAERKFLQGTNNNIQLKKIVEKEKVPDCEKERLIMTNIAVTKISLQQHTLNIVLVRIFQLALLCSLRLMINFHFTIQKKILFLKNRLTFNFVITLFLFYPMKNL